MHTPGQFSIPVTTLDTHIHHLEHMAMRMGTIEAMADLQREFMHRDFYDNLFRVHFEPIYDAPIVPHNFNCLRILVAGVELHCGKWSPYAMRYVRNLANYCDTRGPQELAHLYSKIGDYCSLV